MGGYMYKKAIEVLNKLVQNGYLAYIVGGYPRDTLLDIKTKDIDICTNAKPMEIMDLFDTESLSDVKYGSVNVIYKIISLMLLLSEKILSMRITESLLKLNILMIWKRIY